MLDLEKPPFEGNDWTQLFEDDLLLLTMSATETLIFFFIFVVINLTNRSSQFYKQKSKKTILNLKNRVRHVFDNKNRILIEWQQMTEHK